MEIDIEKAKHAFNEYVKKYNPDDEKIKLKIYLPYLHLLLVVYVVFAYQLDYFVY